MSWEAQEKGYPPVRPVFWSDSDDSALWGVDDAFFLGDTLLVYPIFEEGVRSRSVILPKGHWYNFWDGTAHEGGREITLDAPLEQLPLLVRAGSILPMEESEQLILHLYPPAEGTSAGYLYGDAGDGYGEWRLEQFRMMRSHGAHRPEGRSQDGLELTWETLGDYAFPYKSVRLHLHGFKVQQAWVDETEVTCQGQQLECQPFRQVRFKGEFAAVTP